MKVFIEVSAGTDQRPIYNEKTLEYQKTIKVNKPYPYAYGFILNTLSGDGLNLDCYIITTQSLKSGSIIDAEPIGMVEYIEDDEEDHKILMAMPGEQIVIDNNIENKIEEFAEYYFDDRPEKKTVIGSFLGYDEAVDLIDKCKREL